MTTLTILAVSWQQMLLVALIILILFGGKKIPELMKGLGGGIKEFKDAIKEEEKKSEKKDEQEKTNP